MHPLPPLRTLRPKHPAWTAAAVLLLSSGPLAAQQIADPNAPGSQRATVLQTPGGVPLVNITTPSAGGVSRNSWRQFDVQPAGVILNNSRGAATTTLGGAVPGNPWLAGGSARVILNEVRSSDPSHLKGFVEVAGQRAEVVIANPAGIQVNGGGFLNASRVTLTTGVPVFNAGALDAYRVQGGSVRIDGSGLDLRDADHAAILARAVELNAGLWASRLQVVTGTNTVAASDLGLVGSAEPAGPAPAFALDVAALGGLYAGQIHLIGTEAGLGVNLQGVVIAQAGDLQLDLKGRLTVRGGTLATTAAGSRLAIGVQALSNEDGALLYSGGDLVIAGALDARGKPVGQARSVDNLSAGIHAAGELSIASASLRNERRGVAVSEIGVLDETVALAMPDWWVNGKNEFGKPIELTSNQIRHHLYLLDPANILSDQVLTTADGNRIHRLEVALDPSDSVFHAAVGAYANYRGVRERIAPGGPATVVLYASARQDGVANPDQVSGAPDPLAPLFTSVSEWQRDTLAYSSAHGRCSTNCTLLQVQPGYDDPTRDLLRTDQTNLVPTHPGLELWRSARHTVVEDRLAPGAGLPAAMRAGGAVRLDIGESLHNRYADILAGTTLQVIAPEASVLNEGQVLKRTERFAITSHTAGLGSFDWTKPEQSTVIGALPARLIGVEGLHIEARSLHNSELGRPTGLPTDERPGAGLVLPEPTAPARSSAPGQAQPLLWSDLLSPLGADPAALHKRLSDGFAEQWQWLALGSAQGAQLAGERVVLDIGEDLVNTGGRVKGGVVQMKAGRDLSHIGGVLQAREALVLSAEGRVTIASTTHTTEHHNARVQQSRTELASVGELRVGGGGEAGGQLHIEAGEDVVLQGARVRNHTAGGSTTLSAGRDVKMQTITVGSREAVAADARNRRGQSETREIGSEISAEGDVGIAAGRDVAARAASVQAGGELRLQAGEDITLEAGRAQSESELHLYRKRSGPLGSKRSEERRSSASDVAIGTALGGHTVVLEAGRDIALKGSSVIGDQGAQLQAGRNVRIEADTNTASQSHFREVRKSGVFTSGSSVTLGKQQQSTDQQQHSATAAASTVGAIHGDVRIEAGQAYRQTGSDVLAPAGDVDIAAREVAITEARERHGSRSEQRFKQSGVSVGLGGALVEGLQGMAQTAQAMRDAGNHRVQALGAATLALQGAQVAGAAQALANAPTKAAGVSLNISLGSSKSSSVAESRSDSARGSTVAAGGDLRIVAAGAGQASDLRVQGSDLAAAGTARLSAEGDIALQAAREHSEDRLREKSSGGSVGISLSAGSQGVGLGFTASAQRGQGQGDGEALRHRNTHIGAGAELVLRSGGDTTLQGAVAQAGRIDAAVGGNLRITSPQDTASQDQRRRSAGVSGTVGVGAGGSLSAGKSTGQSRYASVVEPSGLRAGDGGFQVEVQGHTALEGGLIGSSAQAARDGRNALQTGSLSASDIHNEATASASSSGVQVSSDMLTQGKYGAAKGAIGNALNQADESAHAEGTTRATVSAARITITDEAAQRTIDAKTGADTLASLHRDADTAHTAAQPLDLGVMQRRVQAEQVIRQQLIQAVTAFTDEAYRSRLVAVPRLIKVECPAGQDCEANRDLLVRTPATKEEFAQSKQQEILAVNGILNDEKRGAELAYQNVNPIADQPTKKPEKPSTIYVMHIKPAENTISELLGVAYEKIVESADYGLANFLGYTTADELYAELTRLRGDAPTVLLGHSRGTLVQGAAFTILANRKDEQGNTYTNPNLVVRGVGGAADAEAYSEKAAKVIGDPTRTDQITYHYFSNDPVSTSSLAGGNPGVWSLADLWSVFTTNNSMHSCYGTGAPGCKQVEIPMPGGPQGTPEGNAKLIEFVGGERVNKDTPKGGGEPSP